MGELVCSLVGHYSVDMGQWSSTQAHKSFQLEGIAVLDWPADQMVQVKHYLGSLSCICWQDKPISLPVTTCLKNKLEISVDQPD